MSESQHPNQHDLYTPVTPELIELLERMRIECGSWRLVAAAIPMRMKTLRRIRRPEKLGVKAVSQTMLDRMCTTTGIGSIDEFEWFTADDMVALGIWEKPVLIHEHPIPTVEEKAERRRAKRRERTRRRRQLRRRLMKGLPPE